MNFEIARVHFAAIDSTNSWAKANLHLIEPGKIILATADTQFAGRGRFNNRWISPSKKNIYASFSFFVPNGEEKVLNLGQILSLSALRTLETSGFQPQLKWPNDLLLSGKKVGGILCETTTYKDRLCMIAGIGLNINMSIAEVEGISQPATSLFIEKGQRVDLEKLTQSLAENFKEDLVLFLTKGFAAFFEEYRGKLAHAMLQPLKFHDKGSLQEGIFHSINPDGSLNLLLPSGEVKKYYSF